MKHLKELIQGYLGMLPQDKGCKSYEEMGNKMEKEIKNIFHKTKTESLIWNKNKPHVPSPRLGSKVLIKLFYQSRNEYDFQVAIYAKSESDRRTKGFFQNYKHLLLADGETMEAGAWNYLNVVEWRYID